MLLYLQASYAFPSTFLASFFPDDPTNLSSDACFRFSSWEERDKVRVLVRRPVKHLLLTISVARYFSSLLFLFSNLYARCHSGKQKTQTLQTDARRINLTFWNALKCREFTAKMSYSTLLSFTLRGREVWQVTCAPRHLRLISAGVPLLGQVLLTHL